MLVTIVSGPDQGRRARIDEEPLVIGRDDDCGLVLHDRTAAERHVHLRPLPTGAVMLNDLDLDPARGAWVGDERVDCAILRGGEKLRVGDTLLALESDGAPAPAAARPAAPPARPPRRAGPVRRLRDRRRRRAPVVATASPSMLERIHLRRSVRRATILAGTVLVGLILAVVAIWTGVLGGDSGQTRVEAIVAQAAPSTVLVQAQRGVQRSGNGTGWVLDAREGLIVTNAHVVNAGDSFTVGVGDTLRSARVVSSSPCEDLAVLRVDDPSGLRTLPLGSQRSLRLGESVVAVGYPGNASRSDALTSTTGVVSVVRSEYREPALDVPHYPNVVQTDAAVNPGNSGGPLLDLDGRVVGVTSAGRTLSPQGRIIQGQSYAIGVDRVREVVGRLRAGRSTDWYGLGLRHLEARALRQRHLPAGLVVASVTPGTPAARAGVPAGGRLLVTAIGSTPVSNTLVSYCDAVSQLSPSKPVKISALDVRTGRPRSITIG
jgi:S1-C subfamily serine protease